MSSVTDIVQEYFPEATPEERQQILYGKTGWPGWLYQGEETLRSQLQAEQEAREKGMTRCYKCGNPFTFQDTILTFCPACQGEESQ